MSSLKQPEFIILKKKSWILESKVDVTAVWSQRPQGWVLLEAGRGGGEGVCTGRAGAATVS